MLENTRDFHLWSIYIFSQSTTVYGNCGNWILDRVYGLRYKGLIDLGLVFFHDPTLHELGSLLMHQPNIGIRNVGFLSEKSTSVDGEIFFF